MKAAVCYEPGKPLRIEEIDIDPPHAGEVKVRLVATAICHSDIHALHGDWNGNFPVVVGHEAAGIVEEIGENVTLTAPGDNVVVSLLRTCGHCFYCAQGLSNLCNGTFALQTESRLHNKRGDPIYQGIRTAAFAEYVIVDQSQIVQVQQTIPLEKAALLACGVITGVGSVVNTGQVKPGSSVVVIGLGGVGVRYPMIEVRGLLLASTATRNSLPSDALASTAATSGASDKSPVLAQHGRTTSEQGAFKSTENVLPRHGVLAWNPTVQLERSHVGEPSLSSKLECLSLPEEYRTHAQESQASPPARVCFIILHTARRW